MENTITKCPEWCAEEHNEKAPANSGDCFGKTIDLEEVWNRSIGNGEADGSITRSLEKGVERYYLDIQVVDGLLPSELESAAQQFEQLASIIRGLNK